MPTVLQWVQSKVDSALAEGRVWRNENFGRARVVLVEKLISIDRRSAEYKYIWSNIGKYNCDVTIISNMTGLQDAYYILYIIYYRFDILLYHAAGIKLPERIELKNF